MRNLLAVGMALVVILGIVSGNLWHELRSARQLNAGLEDQLAQTPAAVAQAATVPPPPPTIEVQSAPPVAVQLPESPPSATVEPAPVQTATLATRVIVMPAPERPLGMPTLTAPLVGNTDDERRNEALAQSDRTAAARVSAWNSALGLTPAQLQVLNATTTEELRRETEDSLRITSSSGNMDARSAARLKVETVTRQHETLVRIHEKMKSQLSPEQSDRMRAMFDRWLVTNMARARLEEEVVLSTP